MRERNLNMWITCRFHGRVAQAAVILMVALPPVAALAGASVEGLRFGEHKTKTRIVLDLGEKIDFQYFTLADPYRVIVDLPEVEWNLSMGAGEVGVGLVERFRYGLFRPGTSRLVLDVAAPVRVKSAFLLESKGKFGQRLVLDIVKVSKREFKRSHKKLPPPKPLPKTDTSSKDLAALPRPRDALKGAAKPPARRSEKHVIVLDPGHGGVDPGAIGRSGQYEKHLVLSMAKELKKKLEATGRYKVVLTRKRDIFIRLRNRLQKAREAGGDLFISLHADIIKNSRIRGLSVYTLSESASDMEAEALAKWENKADLIAGIDLTNEPPEVTNILIDLAQRETMNLSAHFASFLIQDLRREVKLLHKTHRFAGFAVLKAPDIPSVLVELGYLSNPTEERLLRDRKYRERLAAAVVSAVDRYFKWKDRLSRS